MSRVSPNSIRSRILKGNKRSIVKREVRSFTQFDPFEDTESE